MTKAPRTPRAKQIGTLVGVRLQPDDLAQLDAYAGLAEAPMSRPEAIRRILRDHFGFAPTAISHPKPRGPATEAVKAMDEAINAHKTSRQKAEERKRT